MSGNAKIKLMARGNKLQSVNDKLTRQRHASVTFLDKIITNNLQTENEDVASAVSSTTNGVAGQITDIMYSINLVTLRRREIERQLVKDKKDMSMALDEAAQYKIDNLYKMRVKLQRLLDEAQVARTKYKKLSDCSKELREFEPLKNTNLDNQLRELEQSNDPQISADWTCNFNEIRSDPTLIFNEFTPPMRRKYSKDDLSIQRSFVPKKKIGGIKESINLVKCRIKKIENQLVKDTKTANMRLDQIAQIRVDFLKQEYAKLNALLAEAEERHCSKELREFERLKERDLDEEEAVFYLNNEIDGGESNS